jgi:UDP-galactopyranose mutase
MFDWLIVGAGFAGSVLAERLANETDGQILLIDRRSHIGGNAYDRYDESGELVPGFGRHVLQTTNERVLAYLSRFADWQPYAPAGEREAEQLAMFAASDGQPLVPARGYTNLFERMLEARNIKIMLNVDYREIQSVIPFRRLIYTGSLDEYFDYCYGKLPYWSADHQEMAPHLAPAQAFAAREIVLGRPEDGAGYPVAEASSRALFQRYQDLAEAAVNIFFTGRLPTYRYCTMAEVVAQSLALFDRIGGEGPGHDVLPEGSVSGEHDRGTSARGRVPAISPAAGS